MSATNRLTIVRDGSETVAVVLQVSGFTELMLAETGKLLEQRWACPVLAVQLEGELDVRVVVQPYTADPNPSPPVPCDDGRTLHINVPTGLDVQQVASMVTKRLQQLQEHG